MKDNVEIGRLTKFDYFRLNKDQVMDLETWFKIHTNVSNFRLSPLKPCKLLKILIQFSDNCKIPSSTYYLEITEVKINMFAHF